MKKRCMAYKELLEKRLARKKDELNELSNIVCSEGVATPIEKRKYIEVRAVVTELELCLDIAGVMFSDKV